MTYLFDLNPVEQRGAFQTAVTNATDIVNAPFFEGMGTGLVSGVQSAYYRDIYNSANPQTEGNLQQNAIDQLEKLKPDPRSVGTAGQILYSLGDIFGTVYAQAMGGNITPATLAMGTGTSYANSQQQLYIRQGIDPVTAQSLAATDAAAVGLGVVLPAAVPGRFATRAFSGGAINTVIGTGQRAALSYELENNGYPDLARQYQAFDAAHVLTDFTLGAFFGGFLGPRPAARDVNARVLPSDVDATLTMGNAAHIETSTIPGMPTDNGARQAHVNAVNKALDDLMNGRPVDVGDQVTTAAFDPRPESLLRQEVTLEVEQHLATQLQSLKRELERRGLSTEDIDQTAPVTLREVTPGMPGSAAITQVIPNAAIGQRTSVKIEGNYQDATWAVVDAKDVEATMAKGPNQFRDRFRAASQAQIEKIANAPDFNLLEASPLMDFGAPTLTNDGLIVGGNGRFAGVARSYGRGTGEIYRSALRASLDKFGLKEADLAGKERPVLVRVLDNQVDVQRVAIASNEGAGLRMSALEQAKVDSVRLGDITGMSVGDNGEVNLAGNISYIQRWAGQFPETEQAALVDKAGRLSQEGEKRLRNAILFRAYGDSPTLERLVESTDPGARNVATALVRTAPTVAEIKAEIGRGNLYALDISEDVTAAVEKLDALRSSGQKIKDYLAQDEMFGAELTPVSRMMLEQFDKNMRSAKAMTDIISGYYDGVREAGNPNQADMFGGRAPTREGLLNQAIVDANPAGKRLAERIAADYDKVVKEYNANPETKNGRVINTDEARELSPEYRDDRSLSASVQDAASGLVKRIYADKLAQPTPEGLESAVLFLGGGGGSGKSTGLELMGPVVDRYEMIYDTTLASKTGEKAIQAALDNGRDVTIAFTLRDPVEAFESALVRAMSMEKQKGSGRTVPLEVLAEDHPAARANFEALAAKYADDPRVGIMPIDNTRGKDNAAIVDVAELPTVDYNNLKEKFYEILQTRYADGSISDSVYRGVLDTYRPEQQDFAQGGGRGVGEVAQQRAQGDAGRTQVDPDAQIAADVLTDRPDLTIADENGRPMLASDALAQADAEIATAMREAPGFDAAVSCALRNS
jgi:hypothetical protein